MKKPARLKFHLPKLKKQRVAPTIIPIRAKDMPRDKSKNHNIDFTTPCSVTWAYKGDIS